MRLGIIHWSKCWFLPLKCHPISFKMSCISKVMTFKCITTKIWCNIRQKYLFVLFNQLSRSSVHVAFLPFSLEIILKAHVMLLYMPMWNNLAAKKDSNDDNTFHVSHFFLLIGKNVTAWRLHKIIFLTVIKHFAVQLYHRIIYENLWHMK